MRRKIINSSHIRRNEKPTHALATQQIESICLCFLRAAQSTNRKYASKLRAFSTCLAVFQILIFNLFIIIITSTQSIVFASLVYACVVDGMLLTSSPKNGQSLCIAIIYDSVTSSPTCEWHARTKQSPRNKNSGISGSNSVIYLPLIPEFDLTFGIVVETNMR